MTSGDSTFELGAYRGQRYIIHASATPTERTPQEFSVSLYYRDPDLEANVEIARIDTSHGHTHFDRLYRRDEPKEAVNWSYWEAVEHLLENWRTYAEMYDRTHRPE